MGKNKVSMADIAKKLGISKNAVSLALSNKKGVSEKTKERVIKACLKMGYSYQNPKDIKDGRIGIVTPDYFLQDPYFFSGLLGAMEKETRDRGYSLSLASVDEEAMEKGTVPDLLADGGAEGLLVIGNIGEVLFERIQALKIPKVVVDYFDPALQMDAVMTDNVHGTYHAIKFLAEKGMSRIGFIGNIHAAVSYRERWEGFQRAISDLSLPLKMEYCYLGSEVDYRRGYGMKKSAYLDGIRGFIDGLCELPEAIYCASNPITAILMNVLTAKKLAIPQDISVIGFDDSEMMKLGNPPMTMVHIFKEFYGKRAVEQLFFNMNHRKKPVELIRIGTELIVRGSVRL